MDFEQAMVNALRSKHPQCSINFCLFHLVRNMKARLTDEQTRRFTTDAAFAQAAKMITSLAFVPLEDLTPALAALEDHLPGELEGVLDWFIINYVGRLRNNGTRTRPLFRPEEWSVYERTMNGTDRTNNFAEAYHRTLQHAIGHGHPPIWKFINILRERQKIIDVDFEHFLAGNAPPPKATRYREADRRILRILERYNREKAQSQINDDHQYGQIQTNPNLRSWPDAVGETQLAQTQLAPRRSWPDAVGETQLARRSWPVPSSLNLLKTFEKWGGEGVSGADQGRAKLGLALEAEAEGEAHFFSKHEVRSSKPRKPEVFEAFEARSF
ncbi:hypothetical protein niasHT_000086 [Heterodera trifolii]|uniref:MULE transposase domain-containing protein n=1 Tax=Heterodera trifolii TaxID=157864 RepID=A0ABD2LW44_9BILA